MYGLTTIMNIAMQNEKIIQHFSEADLWKKEILPSCGVSLKLVGYNLFLEFEFKSKSYMHGSRMKYGRTL